MIPHASLKWQHGRYYRTPISGQNGKRATQLFGAFAHGGQTNARLVNGGQPYTIVTNVQSEMVVHCQLYRAMIGLGMAQAVSDCFDSHAVGGDFGGGAGVGERLPGRSVLGRRGLPSGDPRASPSRARQTSGRSSLVLLAVAALLRTGGADVPEVLGIFDQSLVEVVAHLPAGDADEVDPFDRLLDALAVQDPPGELLDANPEEILGCQALFVVNLEPRTMAGETSEGMLFDIGYADGVPPVLAIPERRVPNGTRAG